MVELDYMETENGTWKPLLEVQETVLPLTKYGFMRMRFLEQEMEAVYLTLRVTDKLYKHCKRVEEQAHKRKAEIVRELRRINKPPQTENFMEMVSYRRMIDHEAEELMLDEIVYNREVTEATEK